MYANTQDYSVTTGIYTFLPIQYYTKSNLPNFPPSYFNLAGCYDWHDKIRPFFEYFPIFSMFLAVGETAGWTGFLCPQLKSRFGSKKGLIIGGCLYGVWHFPIITFTGYQYGFGYFGFPITGLIVFCITSTAFLIICDWLYEKGECIWIPALFRGVLYVAGMSPLVHSKVYWDNASLRLLGPLPTGLLSGVFFIAFAAELFLNLKNKENVK